MVLIQMWVLCAVFSVETLIITNSGAIRKVLLDTLTKSFDPRFFYKFLFSKSSMCLIFSSGNFLLFLRKVSPGGFIYSCCQLIYNVIKLPDIKIFLHFSDSSKIQLD